MTGKAALRRWFQLTVTAALVLGAAFTWRQWTPLLSGHRAKEPGRAAEAEPWLRDLAELQAASDLLSGDAAPAALATGRAAAARGLRAERPEVRLEAIRLAQTPSLDLLNEVVPLLDDSDADVRRAALVAVGAARDAIADDELLRWLHDPDDDVRKLCEHALRGRGLRDQHLRLGRLLTDPKPQIRLQVLDQLRRAEDLEPGVWLRRLSHDPAPAVRAAALRAAAEFAMVDLSERLQQMSQNDPSPTVRQLAAFYLQLNKSPQ
jgi:HEAT repeat protein